MTTKYDIGHQVWCVSENHLIKDTIDFIAIDSAGINYCTKKLTTETFIEKANIVHNFKYDYSKTNYTNAHGKVIIICPTHGEFTQKATNHTVQKQGCPHCGGSVKYTTEDFIRKANVVHNNFYSYDKAIYTKGHAKISITCPKHGDFEQKAYSHLQSHGCPKCRDESTSELSKSRPDIWSYSGWEEAGNLSSDFDGFSLYVIKCYNDTEQFYKIGKTFTDINRRFRGPKMMPYDWSLVKQVYGSANYISKLEKDIHSKVKGNSYVPEQKFNGYFECFDLSTNIKEILDEFDSGTG